ncbi:MAG: Type 4 fimbrial biogenesis protein PilV [Candidatus Nomurabacteria bacterium GW2011_GWE1_32_28]|uniref:Type 4 fimbrial biogenesis protein PilV n=1 Tax=Candidatus Nomurabacteria bacterium GW2011_GWF1_31_48 TaxID=1618767 RepID=A0A0G0BGR6_9BACT|nr:MAG: Type 4 fimbrial biogenesis protein PilV [Candidatus Nomurabacteria bacterium GW2011_GWF2_30_133]KKP28660.1 MAG: Type 4 fimbrial biogenesis protein PilV [Candidatus Nomurabacteria bacterium GW2011_GWE2_31_40]KKP30237.1 MAG: Type 4 fimbrial biogenesis protein PilV [Candidatus Nomurabacteria bacterium GW2011_GWF1_31_48]KKP34764.1 MAG: Type 4 fimbrial biogenesis protein PilV [Candidatus Nomurabacteria bacterium GW2011_GWE1_32_28]HAS80778.1 hypothetical protein [Candidatus Nomurabacteria bac
MQKDKIKKNKAFTQQDFLKKVSGGFTLVETLVAIAIFTISLISLMSILGSSISNTRFANNKNIAGYLAQEGIEYIRNMRDTYALTGVNNAWGNFRTKLVSCNSSGGECGFNTSLYIPLDSNFIEKCTSDPDICKVYLDNGNYNTNLTGSDSGFTRKIWVNVIDQDKEIKIYSEVEWTQGSGTYNVTFSENLFNWIK